MKAVFWTVTHKNTGLFTNHLLSMSFKVYYNQNFKVLELLQYFAMKRLTVQVIDHYYQKNCQITLLTPNLACTYWQR